MSLVAFFYSINSDIGSNRICHQFRNISHCLIEVVSVLFHDSEGRDVLTFLFFDDGSAINFVPKRVITKLFWTWIVASTRRGALSVISNGKKVETGVNFNGFTSFCLCWRFHGQVGTLHRKKARGSFHFIDDFSNLQDSAHDVKEINSKS